MFFIEPKEYAPEWVKNLAEKQGVDFKICAVMRDYGREAKQYPALRNRLDEITPMLRGFVGNLEAPVSIHKRKGAELYRENGFEAVGAQFVADYMILLA